MPEDFVKRIRKDIVNKLKREIELATPERAGEISFNIAMYSWKFGLTKDDLKELQEVFIKKLKKEVV